MLLRLFDNIDADDEVVRVNHDAWEWLLRLKASGDRRTGCRDNSDWSPRGRQLWLWNGGDTPATYRRGDR